MRPPHQPHCSVLTWELQRGNLINRVLVLCCVCSFESDTFPINNPNHGNLDTKQSNFLVSSLLRHFTVS